MKKKKC